MKIYELEEIDYFINEKEAFDKSVFNAAEYNVTLAVPEGTDLNAHINVGDQITGNYTVNGLTTEFESLVQDISITRQFQAGYDMYNLKLSENILNVARQSILDVPDGGTGVATLNGVLKGNGASPVSTAVDGLDYWSPQTLEPVTLNGNWLVEHLGGQNYRLSQIYRVNTSCTQAHQGQYMSDVITFPALPSGFATVPYSLSYTNSPANSGPVWMFNQSGGIRLKAGASTATVVVDFAISCLTTKS